MKCLIRYIIDRLKKRTFATYKLSKLIQKSNDHKISVEEFFSKSKKLHDNGKAYFKSEEYRMTHFLPGD